MGRIVGLDHISLYAKDLEETLNFYCGKLGFTVLDQESVSFGEFALIRLGDCTIEVIKPLDPEKVVWQMEDNREPVLSHFGLKVEGLDSLYTDLKAKEIQFEPDHIIELDAPLGGLRALSTKGPNGEVINFYEFARKV